MPELSALSQLIFGHAHRAKSHAKARSLEGGCHYCLGTAATDFAFEYYQRIHSLFLRDFAASRDTFFYLPCFGMVRTRRFSELAGPFSVRESGLIPCREIVRGPSLSSSVRLKK